LVAIYDGASRSDAAKIGGVGLQTMRDWVPAFNTDGPIGLILPRCDTAAMSLHLDISGETGSPTASSSPTPTLSTIVGSPGSASSSNLGRSCPSVSANGLIGSNQRDLA
jgi:hypothetical protein